MSAQADAKQKVVGTVDRLADDLEALSHRIHDTPDQLKAAKEDFER